MCRPRNIAMRDYQESVTTGQTPDNVIRYASQETQKLEIGQIHDWANQSQICFGGKYDWANSRLYTVFQPHLDLEAGDNQSLKCNESEIFYIQHHPISKLPVCKIEQTYPYNTTNYILNTSTICTTVLKGSLRTSLHPSTVAELVFCDVKLCCDVSPTASRAVKWCRSVFNFL